MNTTQINKEEISIAIGHSKLKIEWAKNHVSEVEKVIKFLTSREGYVIRPHQDINTGQYVLYIGPEHGIPGQLPLHIGDAIHNLNSVMDFLWSGLARAAGLTIASKITFPRHETRQNLMTMLSNPNAPYVAIKRAFPQADIFILDKIQPYKRANGLIWTLNKLDNINKHRLLIATTNIISFASDLLVRSEDGGTFSQAAGVSINTNGPSISIGFSSPFTIDHNPEPTIGVVFGEVDHFSGEPVLERLINLAEAVIETVQLFEETFI